MTKQTSVLPIRLIGTMMASWIERIISMVFDSESMLVIRPCCQSIDRKIQYLSVAGWSLYVFSSFEVKVSLRQVLQMNTIRLRSLTIFGISEH